MPKHSDLLVRFGRVGIVYDNLMPQLSKQRLCAVYRCVVLKTSSVVERALSTNEIPLLYTN